MNKSERCGKRGSPSGLGLLAPGTTTLCPLFGKMLGSTVHVGGVWGGPQYHREAGIELSQRHAQGISGNQGGDSGLRPVPVSGP